ncbi:alanine racemase, partial [Streptococcus cristatus]|uniref:alanine racemase n=1 Tax=Streptococcus cristatus TaxID=45634 RepID=UPI00163AEFAF
DLSAIAFNIEQIAAHIPRSVQKWAVVKANAYGHGAVPVSQHVQALVDGFCVSNIDEALELREAGIAKSILILSVSSLEAVPLAIQQQITLTVASLAWMEELLSQQADLTGLTVHIKIDSGMGRIGFRDSQEAQQAISRLQAAGAVVEGIFTHFATVVEGIFTHFATADELDTSHFVAQL